MSFLPPDLLPGEPYILGSLTSAGPTQPFFAPASGGGGGGGGPNLVCSTLTTNSGDGEIGGVPDIQPASGLFGIGASTLTGINLWGNLAPGVALTCAATTTTNFDFVFSISTVNNQVGPISEPGTNLQIAADGADGGNIFIGAQGDGTAYIASVASQNDPGTISTLFLVADNVKVFPQGNLEVSSINGAAPGGGGSAFTSSFLLTVPGGASTLVMALPAGQYAYMGQALYTGSNNFLSGTASALQNQTSEQWLANVSNNAEAGNRPADSGSGCSMILNTWENPLSTAKLYINNVNASPAGDATWIGVVGKLY